MARTVTDLGTRSTHQDLKSEFDFIKLKCDLLVEGLRLDPSASEGIGTVFKEQVHFIYDWDFGHHHGQVFPADLVLPTGPDEPPAFDELGLVDNGLIVMFRANDRSRFGVRRVDDRLLLEKDGEHLCDIAFTPRPGYYGRKTSDGVPFQQILVYGGVAGLLSSVSSYCYYFRGGKQCRFCSLVPTKKAYNDELVGIKTAEQVAEATAAAWAFGNCRGLTLTGGILPGRRELDRYRHIVEAVKAKRSWPDPDNLPICAVVGAPAPDEHKTELERLRRTGTAYVSINLEVGNPHMFAAICPGKAGNGGYENWFDALITAVDIFGRGHVRSNFVPGIEPMNDTIIAFKQLADHGIFTHFFQPWCPDPGSLLDGHRSPDGAWYFKLISELADIWDKSDLTVDQLNKFPGANDSLAYDLWRARHGLKVAEMNAKLLAG